MGQTLTKSEYNEMKWVVKFVRKWNLKSRSPVVSPLQLGTGEQSGKQCF